MIKAVVDGMIERRFGRIVNITSASVKSPIPQLGMSNGARAGLTGFVAGLARQVAKHNVTINNLLPGPFLTDRLRSGAAHLAKRNNRTVEEELALRGRENPTGRVGDPAEFGEACAFLCAASSGFLSGTICCWMAALPTRQSRDGPNVPAGAPAGHAGAQRRAGMCRAARPFPGADRTTGWPNQRRGGARFRTGLGRGPRRSTTRAASVAHCSACR